MTRILILIILVWILYLIIKRVSVSANRKEKAEAKPELSIVQCVSCGCHVPESESQLKDGKVICNNPECQNPEYNK
jgi:formylmethanofuran dehydrogenase subunit E